MLQIVSTTPDGIRSSSAIFQPDARYLAAERRQIERELRVSLAQGGFALEYQPRFSLETGEAQAVEAVIRWPDRHHGTWISPAVFLPVAESSSLISDIGGWVLKTACQEATRATLDGLTLAINISARQLQDGVLCSQVATALEASGFPAEQLELDLTESSLLDLNTESLLSLSALRDLGVELALGDFGVGYASLAEMKRLPLSVIKIDQSLTRDLPHSREDAAITRAAIEAGHALGLTIVAQGVEFEAQKAFLWGVGCDQAQGFLLGPSLSLAEFSGCPRF